ncbi:HpcH/HpaI aldolase/citrate lyase family protein [Jiella marina]|uniref:HpcH/HpaI aldolase/citrate lyase family protein n=1 Tax=Jiella sp. LLJ827 TaxID=2917712 RepID=UPI00210088D4|nr:CoA ester lyase [Jiella sp. LLJ827]MCQ0988366.1 CoA ester lyase [Jiella sp. LLJ827]
MTEAACPLRSVLFVPAANARALEKSAGLAADGLIFDLEASVVPDRKDEAREALRAHLAAASTFTGFKVVRINALDTSWGTEDLLMARGAKVDAILLPRVENFDTIVEAATALDEMDAPPWLQLWAMIDTPLGILKLGKIAKKGARLRLSGLVVGTNALASATGIAPDMERSELQPWLMQIVLMARANGLAVLDGVFRDLEDADGLAREFASARRMGFDGKTLIHPSQIAPANAAFAPSEEEIAWAERVIAAFDLPENRDEGVLAIDGRMILPQDCEDARRLLARHQAIAARQKSTQNSRKEP